MFLSDREVSKNEKKLGLWVGKSLKKKVMMLLTGFSFRHTSIHGFAMCHT